MLQDTEEEIHKGLNMSQRRSRSGESTADLSFFRMDEQWQERLQRRANETLQLASQKVSTRKLRSFNALMGVSEPKPFHWKIWEGGLRALVPKMKHNLEYFLANYFAFVSGTIAFSIITSPFLLILIGTVCFGWWMFLVKLADLPVFPVTQSFFLSRKQGSYIMIAFTIISAWYLLESVFSALLFWSSLTLVGAHAACRDPSLLQATLLQEEEEDPEVGAVLLTAPPAPGSGDGGPVFATLYSNSPAGSDKDSGVGLVSRAEGSSASFPSTTG